MENPVFTQFSRYRDLVAQYGERRWRGQYVTRPILLDKDGDRVSFIDVGSRLSKHGDRIRAVYWDDEHADAPRIEEYRTQGGSVKRLSYVYPQLMLELDSKGLLEKPRMKLPATIDLATADAPGSSRQIQLPRPRGSLYSGLLSKDSVKLFGQLAALAVVPMLVGAGAQAVGVLDTAAKVAMLLPPAYAIYDAWKKRMSGEAALRQVVIYGSGGTLLATSLMHGGASMGLTGIAAAAAVTGGVLGLMAWYCNRRVPWSLHQAMALRPQELRYTEVRRQEAEEAATCRLTAARVQQGVDAGQVAAGAATDLRQVLRDRALCSVVVGATPSTAVAKAYTEMTAAPGSGDISQHPGFVKINGINVPRATDTERK